MATKTVKIKIKKSESPVHKFSDISQRLTKDLSTKEKKDGGIFFTPGTITKELIKYIPNKNGSKGLKILEPSCGSGEFIKAVLSLGIKKVKIDAVELNKKIFDEVNKEFKNYKEVNIINKDYLDGAFSGSKYNVVIGNPPYFVMNKADKDKYATKFGNYYVGRPNIYMLFIVRALTQLVKGGVLIFLIPKSFLNSAYYNLVRKMIYKKCDIIDIVNYSDHEDFLETKQETIGLVVKKNGSTSNNKFCVVNGDNYLFNTSENTTQMRKLLEDSSTLRELDFVAKTGSVVWNQHKPKLTSDSKKTLLIYNSNVTTGKFAVVKFTAQLKHQYITDMDDKSFGTDSGSECVIVVNRGNGNTSYNFYYSLISSKDIGPFCVENHLNVITGNGSGDYTIDDIYKSLQDPRTAEFIDMFVGNGALSASELNSIVPFYLDADTGSSSSDSESDSGSDAK